MVMITWVPPLLWKVLIIAERSASSPLKPWVVCLHLFLPTHSLKMFRFPLAFLLSIPWKPVLYPRKT